MSINARTALGRAAAGTVVLLIAGLGLAGCAAATSSPDRPDASVAQPAAVPRGVVDGAFQLGDGPVVIELFTDASCPHCRIFDEASFDALRARLDAGEVTLRLHPMNYVSAKHADATAFSTRAMNLLAAVADSGQLERLPAVYSGVLAAQPADAATEPPGDSELLHIAEQAGVTMTTQLKSDVATGRWNMWVQRTNDEALGMPIGDSGIVLQYVPTVVVANRQLEIREDGTDLVRLHQLIDTAS